MAAKSGKPESTKQGRYQLEHHGQKPLTAAEFRYRLLNFSLLALCVIAAALGVGMLGYHYFEDLPWLDAYLNAAMILSGMGPVDEIETRGGKIFAGLYSIFAGVMFLATASILFAPVFHRLLHKFHFDDQDVAEGDEEEEGEPEDEEGEGEPEAAPARRRKTAGRPRAKASR